VETPQQRRKQDDQGAGRPLHERVILTVLGLVGLGAAMSGAWWLWNQSGASAVVRDGSPNWHPNGQQIIFSSEEGGKAELFVTDLSGGHRDRLTTDNARPADEGGGAYSPDGNLIAFHSDRDGNFEIYVMNAEGEAVRRLTDDPGIDQAPAWSPDGKQLVFMSNRGNPGFDVMRMNADGSGVERLTTTGANGYPQYARDGLQLALHVGRDVYVMSLSTRGLRRLTYESHNGNGMYPTWSPDGSRLAFMSWRNGRTEIFTIKADGTEEQVVVTMPTGDAVDPRWSPDGRFLAFVHLPEGGITNAQQTPSQCIVYTVELGTGRLTRISR